MSIEKAIANLKQEMAAADVHPDTGLGEPLFLFSSTLMPVVNVDLLVVNRAGELLLTWRDDGHCGTGWHISGGCIRFKESFLERAQKTALREFGHEVQLGTEVIHVFEIFTQDPRPIEDQNERAHFITLVMAGSMPEDFRVEDQALRPGEPGYMKWFAELPADLLQVQNCYREQWHIIKKKLKGTFQYGYLEK